MQSHETAVKAKRSIPAGLMERVPINGYQTWFSTETPNMKRFSFFSGNQWMIVDVHFGMIGQEPRIPRKWPVPVDL